MGSIVIKRRIIKLVSLLIIAFFIFQLIPSTLTDVEGLINHAQNSREIRSSLAVNNGVFIIGRINIKPAFQQIPVKYCPFNISPTTVFDSISESSSFQDNLFDHRKSIKQSIPNHFHGSKYKNA